MPPEDFPRDSNESSKNIDPDIEIDFENAVFADDPDSLDESTSETTETTESSSPKPSRLSTEVNFEPEYDSSEDGVVTGTDIEKYPRLAHGSPSEGADSDSQPNTVTRGDSEHSTVSYGDYEKFGSGISTENTENDSEEDAPEPSESLIERVKHTLSDEDDESDGNIPDIQSYSYHTSPVALKLDRIAYGLFGHLFRGKDKEYAQFNRALNQARIPISYDIYLSRVMLYSLGSALVGISLGLLIATLFGPLLEELSLGISFPPTVGSFIEAHKLLIAGSLITLISGVITFTTALGVLYYYPYYVAGEREREIDAMLPHAITFMYAMSRGGVNVIAVVRALANAEDSYGEVSNEFQAIINNVDYAKEDLRTAILEEAQETPSDGLKDFLEDLLNVVDTGADMEQFFLNKSDVYLERARTQQQQTLDTLELMSESYVTVFVASPIFILIILVVMAMLGGADITMLYAMTYLGLPAGGVMFAVVIKLISTGGAEGHATLERDKSANTWTNLDINKEELEDDFRYSTYKRLKAKRGLKDRLFAPLKIVRDKPLYSLLITTPFSLAWIAYVATSGLATISLEAMLNGPVWQTLMLFYIPVLISFGTFSILHEIKARRENSILARLPEAFKSASDANERGLTVEESFNIVAENSGGALAKELEQAVNETTWTGNLNDALVQFANSLDVARLSRTIKLITKANEVSGDVQAVLDVAARDVENMHKLDRERKQNAFMYIVIIIVSFFVSMGVIVMLDSNFLSRVAENPAFAEGGSGVPGGGGGGEGGIPIKEFRMSFLHTVMALGGASGLVAGAMANNDPMSGIKYSLVTMGIAIVVFGVT